MRIKRTDEGSTPNTEIIRITGVMRKRDLPPQYLQGYPQVFSTEENQLIVIWELTPPPERFEKGKPVRHGKVLKGRYSVGRGKNEKRMPGTVITQQEYQNVILPAIKGAGERLYQIRERETGVAVDEI